VTSRNICRVSFRHA